MRLKELGSRWSLFFCQGGSYCARLNTRFVPLGLDSLESHFVPVWADQLCSCAFFFVSFVEITE